MATFTPQSKSSTTFTNQEISGEDKIWIETDPEIWEEQEGTSARPFAFTKQDKSSTTFSNQTKN